MDHAAFLGAIVADSEDDAPRLVYADWLEERGDPRGVFIRLQCALERAGGDDPRRPALEDEADDLLAEYEGEWTAPLQGAALGWRFRRGFVEWVEADGTTFLARAASWFAAFPLRGVRLRRIPGMSRPKAAVLAANPLLGRLESLEFRGHFLHDRDIRELLVSPHLGRLTALGLQGQGIETTAIVGILNSPWMAQLRVLDLSDCRSIGDRAARLIAAASHGSGLRTLNLAATNLTVRGVVDLFGSRCLRGLRELDIGAALTRDDLAPYVEVIARSPLFRALSALGVGHRRLEPEQWRNLLSSGDRSLDRLVVSGCDLTDAAAAAIAATPRVSGLTALNLASNRLSADGLRALAESAALASLTELRLGGNNVQDTGAKALAASPHLTRLTSLDLSANNIGGPGLHALASSPNVKHVRELDLSDNYVGLDAVRALADSPNLARLRTLRLSCNQAAGESGAVLAASLHLNPRLRLELTSSDGGFISAATEAGRLVYRTNA
jgi:uncharacterized protein (TIGR02996 family)